MLAVAHSNGVVSFYDLLGSNIFNIYPVSIFKHLNVTGQYTQITVVIDIRIDVRFEVFTVVTMKNGVFWDVTPCGSCKNRRFGGTYRLLHQGDKNR
jgi:hypothetical protein